MGVCKPVVRSDGKRYASVAQAARELCSEQGVWFPDAPKHAASHIARVCLGRPHYNTAYGYGWEYER